MLFRIFYTFWLWVTTEKISTFLFQLKYGYSSSFRFVNWQIFHTLSNYSVRLWWYKMRPLKTKSLKYMCILMNKSKSHLRSKFYNLIKYFCWKKWWHLQSIIMIFSCCCFWGLISLKNLMIRVANVVAHHDELLTQRRYIWMSKLGINIFLISTTSNYLRSSAVCKNQHF